MQPFFFLWRREAAGEPFPGILRSWHQLPLEAIICGYKLPLKPALSGLVQGFYTSLVCGSTAAGWQFLQQAILSREAREPRGLGVDFLIPERVCGGQARLKQKRFYDKGTKQTYLPSQVVYVLPYASLQCHTNGCPR